MIVSTLKPSLAPVGTQRLLPLLQAAIQHPSTTRCRIVTAFAKVSGVARLLPDLAGLRKRGGSVSVIVGIDVKGTSTEALQLLLSSTDHVYVTHEPDRSSTFHPKIYIVERPGHGWAMLGSHNLTAGGLETNYESGTLLQASFPSDQATWDQEVEPLWDGLLPANHGNTVELDGALLSNLAQAGLVEPESSIQARSRRAASRPQPPGGGAPIALPFQGVGVKPATALPKKSIPAAPPTPSTGQVPAPPTTPAHLGSTLVMQVNPHHNAEVFLSKIALNQNPSFFGWPWLGKSIPKRAGNTGYPSRVPVPTMRIRAHDVNDSVIFDQTLQTLLVFYETKSEVRWTIGQDARSKIPPYSILVMRGTNSGIAQGVDYECDFFPPGSPNHVKFLAACDQELPGGGKTRRKMGWL